MSIKILEDLGMHFKKGKTTRKYRLFKVECSCGKVFDTFEARRISACRVCGNKKAGEKRTIHGLHNHRLKSIYQSMKQRCYNPKHKAYKLYGQKGVTVCDEWLNSFTAFTEWAFNNGYKDEYELDKDYLCEQLNISPKIYAPHTCRWVPKSVNAQTNKKSGPNSKLSYEDVDTIYKLFTSKTNTAKELASMYNVDITTIYKNIKQYPDKD